MIEMQVDGRTIEAKDGETILSALKREGIHVPTLCHMEGLLPSGACRMCIVEMEGAQNFVPACSFPVAPGMKIQTRSPRVLDARRTIVELLLSNHPDDCLYCVRSGKCDLQQLSQSMGIRQRMFRGKRNEQEKDVAGPIVRDPEKCILCGRCVRICEEIQGIGAIDFVGRGCKAYIGTAFDQGLNVSTCINCGQCIVGCPTGALTERSYLEEVIAALEDPKKLVVVQHAPSVSVSLAEEFGMEPGQDVDGKMVAALRRIGFDRVFDTSFTADLTIMEEASELAQRIQQGGALPMFTSCSPGWIKFVEQFYPDFIPNLSSCKSPQQMMGAIIKSYFAQRENIDPAQIVSVSIMPCTAKKFESSRPEMAPGHVPDVDYVLTTRELGQLLRMYGVDLLAMTPQTCRYTIRRTVHRRQDFRRQRRRHGSRGPHGTLSPHRQGNGQAGHSAAARDEGCQGTPRQNRRSGSRRRGRERSRQRPQAVGRDTGRPQGSSFHRGHDLPRRVHQRRRAADQRRCQRRARPHAGVVQNRPERKGSRQSQKSLYRSAV